MLKGKDASTSQRTYNAKHPLSKVFQVSQAKNIRKKIMEKHGKKKPSRVAVGMDDSYEVVTIIFYYH